MAIPSVAELLAFLRQHQLLSVTQLEELDRLLSPSLQDARVLAKELLQRDWLTAFQVNQILQGKGQELILGGYVLLERIGEGGMGTVFKAWQRGLGRVVALKVIRQERLANPQAIKRFEHEVRAAAQLNHVNVVRAYDADKVGDCHFLVMEFVPGIDLARLVKHAGPLPVDRACEFIVQAAQGLQHAFENRMVHRDIKPHNLLLTAADDMVKVLDMGLARLERIENDNSESSSTLTVDGAVMGSFDYIAPEQARNARKVDIRADLYGLGCTLYYLLAGQVPFPGGSAMEKLCKHQFEAPTPIEKLRPEVPAPVAAVVAKLMAKSADERYQTPAELVYALEHLNDAPSMTSAPTQADQPVDEATNSFSYMATSDTAEDSKSPSQVQMSRRQWRMLAAYGGAALVLFGFIGWAIVASLPNKGPDKSNLSEPREFRAQKTETSNRVPPTDNSGKVSQANPFATLELLPLIDLSRDVVQGKWKKNEQGDLLSTTESYDRIAIPYRPPAVYDLHIECTKASANTQICPLLIGGNRPFRFIVGAEFAAFDLVDNLKGDNNRTKKKRSALPNEAGSRLRFRIEVRKEGVQGFLDDVLLTSLSTDFANMDLPSHLPMKDRTALGMQTTLGPATFHRIKVVEISGPGTFTRPEDPAAKKAAEQRKLAQPRPKDIAKDPTLSAPFVILATGMRTEQRHPTLAAAVDASQSGDTIEIRGDGPFLTGPIDLKKKALAIRAGGGCLPHLLYQSTDPKAKEPLLKTEAPLVLEGLTLERAAHPIAEDYLLGARILVAYKALHVAHCRLIGTKIQYVASLHGMPVCILRNSEILGDTAVGISYFPASSSLLSLENNLVAVKSHGLWFNQPLPDLAKAVVTVRHNTIRCGNSLNFGYQPSLDFVKEFDPKAPGLRLDALGNVFDSFLFFPDHKSLPLEKAVFLLPKLLSFQDDYNLYVRSKGMHFLGVFRELAPKGLYRFETLAEWHQFWGIAKSTSQVGIPVFQGGDVRAKALSAPTQLTPADFRLAKGSPGQGVLPGGKDLGADVDLVGPGDAYERWQKTPAYQEWRKQTDDLMAKPAPGEKAAWQSLFNGNDLTGWKPSSVNLTRVVDGAIELTATDKVPLIVVTRETTLGDFHLRLEIKSADAATPAQATINAILGENVAVGFGFPTKDFKNITFAGIVNGEFRRASWRDGHIVAKEAPRNSHGPFPGRLEADRWQRVDFVRLGDTCVCFLDDRLVGMVGDARAKGADGKLADLTKMPCRGFSLGGTRSGTVLYRKIEVREITTLPAEFLDRIAWQPLFYGTDLDGWQISGSPAALAPEMAAVVLDEGLPAIQLKSSAKSFTQMARKEKHGDFHLRFDVKVPLVAGKDDTRLGVMTQLGTPNLTFSFKTQGPPGVASYKGQFRQGLFRDGAMVPDGPIVKALSLPGDALERDHWYRVDFYRRADTCACALDGRLVGAITDLRIEGAEGTVTRAQATPLLVCNQGTVLFRNVEIRRLSELPLHLFAPPISAAWRFARSPLCRLRCWKRPTGNRSSYQQFWF